MLAPGPVLILAEPTLGRHQCLAHGPQRRSPPEKRNSAFMRNQLPEGGRLACVCAELRGKLIAAPPHRLLQALE